MTGFAQASDDYEYTIELSRIQIESADLGN